MEVLEAYQPKVDGPLGLQLKSKSQLSKYLKLLQVAYLAYRILIHQALAHDT